ncbi:hypothetical protein LINPERPRIM_LOCUS20860 [Linum perenne]
MPSTTEFSTWSTRVWKIFILVAVFVGIDWNLVRALTRHISLYRLKSMDQRQRLLRRRAILENDTRSWMVVSRRQQRKSLKQQSKILEEGLSLLNPCL